MTEHTATIALTGKKGEGLFAIIAAEDFEEVSKYKWHLQRGYAERTLRNGDKITHEKLHCFIQGKAPEGYVVDHINGDKLDNRKSNLRFCTIMNNTLNRGLSSTSMSGYKGVSFSTYHNKYGAYITHGKKRIHIGYFDKKEDAANAYDYYALKLHTEFARLNFPDKVPVEPPKRETSSRYIGIHWSSKDKVYYARFNYNKVSYHVGGFKSEIEAAFAYNKKVLEVLGEKAHLKLLPIDMGAIN